MSQQNLSGNSGSSMSENELLNKLHLLDENGEIKLDRLMDRKGTQNQNKYVYDHIKWVKPNDRSEPAEGFTADDIKHQICMVCKKIWEFEKGETIRKLKKHYEICKFNSPQSYIATERKRVAVVELERLKNAKRQLTMQTFFKNHKAPMTSAQKLN